jgi:hypothetical protein
MYLVASYTYVEDDNLALTVAIAMYRVGLTNHLAVPRWQIGVWPLEITRLNIPRLVKVSHPDTARPALKAPLSDTARLLPQGWVRLVLQVRYLSPSWGRVLMFLELTIL